ncbi:MAG: hypothetical protein GY754_34905 [bacterium]|nr:hypothetical protein [bacterium]
MEKSISHDREEETIEAKTRWFKSLSIYDRMEILCSITDMALTLNPKLADKKDAKQTNKRIRILSAS